MAIYKIFPSKDASLYTLVPSKNTGLDEILEASTTIEQASPQVSRYLLEFSQTEINNLTGESLGYSNFAYDVIGSTIDEVVYPSIDPMVFEVKYPDQDIIGRVVAI